MDVLIVNPCGSTGEIVARSLEAHGVSTSIMKGPNARKMPDFYIRALHRAVEETGAKMILPIFFPEVLSARRDEFRDVIIPLESAEKLVLLDNKISACRLADSLGIPQPRIYGDPDDVQIFPTVFKRPTGLGGDSVYFPKTRKALDNILKTAPDFLIQDFIEGENVCVDALRWDGFFYAAAYRVLDTRLKGVSLRRESIVAPQLAEYARMILDAVDYHGVCGVDFRMERSSLKPYFLECNPRFSGGLESAIASGFDIPWLFYRLATGQSVNASEIRFSPGIRTGQNLTPQEARD